MNKRGSGVLLHITSLPSRHGIGDFGPEAFRFVDFLAETGQSYWQVLPLNPTDSAHGNSPYSSVSSFAIEPLFISLELLVSDGYLTEDELQPVEDFPADRIRYRKVLNYKIPLINKAYRSFVRSDANPEFELFCRREAEWLDDFALFRSVREHNHYRPWSDWDQSLKVRDSHALQEASEQFRTAIEREKFLQFLCHRQWSALKQYANDRGIQLVGDVPIYVNYDSVDVWSHQGIFKLDSAGNPAVVAGVPPDYFSSTGQLWGNPVYNWDALKASGYAWWIKRLHRALTLFDIVRIDHFRGLVAYWEVPASEKTAINGHWVKVPVHDFFDTLQKHFFSLPIIAEDLGLITADVREVLAHYKLPCMKVLQFAFGEDDPKHPYLPHNYLPRCIVYTGTHDNNTVRGWFENEAEQKVRQRVIDYLGYEVGPENVHKAMIRLAMASTAGMVVIPMQDVLGLGQEARMNIPSVAKNNWRWRLDKNLLNADSKEFLAHCTRIYGRT